MSERRTTTGVHIQRYGYATLFDDTDPNVPIYILKDGRFAAGVGEMWIVKNSIPSLRKAVAGKRVKKFLTVYKKVTYGSGFDRIRMTELHGRYYIDDEGAKKKWRFSTYRIIPDNAVLKAYKKLEQQREKMKNQFRLADDRLEEKMDHLLESKSIEVDIENFNEMADRYGEQR